MFKARRALPSPEILGLISFEGLISEKMAVQTLTMLRGLPGTPPVRGLVLRISSGGGSLGAAQAIAEGIAFVTQELGIPSVASVTDIALSAGFYVAQSADKVFATGAALVGGAGAVFRTFSATRLLQTLGLDYEAIASGPLKEALFPAASLSDAQRKSLQAVVNNCSEQFLEAVCARRPRCSDEICSLLSEGRILTGAQAHNAGLVDGIGGMFAAIAGCAELANVEMPSLRVLDSDPAPEQQRSGLTISEFLGRLFPA